MSGSMEFATDSEKTDNGVPDTDAPQQPPAGPLEDELAAWLNPANKSNPHNWSRPRKWLYTAVSGLLTFSATFASSVFSTAEVPTSKEFGVSQEVMVLGLSLFMVGYCVGPLIWGPMSEARGRKLPLGLGILVFIIFQIPIAVAQNVQTVLVCRFLAGVFACAPLAIVGAMLGDFWDPVMRSYAVCVYTSATFSGPVFGPIVGGFLVDSKLGWRWTAWITMIMGALFWVLEMLIVPETYNPILRERWKADREEETKKAASAADASGGVDENGLALRMTRTLTHSVTRELSAKGGKSLGVREFITKYMKTPIVMIVTEPILFVITLYMSVVYGILYLFFEAYPVSFQQQRGWNEGVGALPFLAIFVGVCFGNITLSTTTALRTKRKYIENGNRMVPEERLIPMMVGAVVLPIGLFWFAWTSSPKITWVPQVLAGAPTGMGIQLTFSLGLNYIIDVYRLNAASAISANTFLRSTAAAGFPLFATPMYHNLGVNWATTILAFISLVLMPAPFLFWIYGPRIRASGRFSRLS